MRGNHCPLVYCNQKKIGPATPLARTEQYKLKEEDMDDLMQEKLCLYLSLMT